MDAPALLYHYTSFEKFLSMLQSRKLRASDARYLNDTSEVDYGFEKAKERIESHSPGLMAEENSRAFLCCFSREGNLLSQWRAYCPAGGVSIGFSRDALMKIAEPQLFALKRCAYTDDEIESLLNALDDEVLREKVMPHPTGSSASGFRTQVWHWAFQAACQIKHRDFFAEHEWRLMYTTLFQNGAERIKVMSSGSWLRPYIELDMCIDSKKCYDGNDPYLWDIGIRDIVVGPHPAPSVSRVAVGDAIRANRISNLSDENYAWGGDDGTLMNGISIRYCDIPFRPM